NVFLAALAAGVVALIAVSLATAPEPAGSIEPFFERLATSSDDDRTRSPLLLIEVPRLARTRAARGWRAFCAGLVGFAVGVAVRARARGSDRMAAASVGTAPNSNSLQPGSWKLDVGGCQPFSVRTGSGC